jgi:hypothetical protein
MTYHCTVSTSNQVWVVTAVGVAQAKAICRERYGFWPDNVVQVRQIPKDAYAHEQSMNTNND